MGAGAVALALGLVVWAACLQAAAGCGFPLITDAAGRAVPDAFVQITAAPRAGGAAVQRGVFLGKVAAFGPCPPAKADAVSLPVRLANASGAPLRPTLAHPLRPDAVPPGGVCTARRVPGGLRVDVCVCLSLWVSLSGCACEYACACVERGRREEREQGGEPWERWRGGEFQRAAVNVLLLAGGMQEACDRVDPSPRTIIVADRGTCNFLNKTLHAEAANASGILVGNTAVEGVCVCGSVRVWQCA